MKNTRIVNGYPILYLPEHPRAMKGKNWHGYVYEHIKVAEETLGRPLLKNECVHHLDGNRGNNRSENLLVLERSQHGKLHVWMSLGANGLERFIGSGFNCRKPKNDKVTKRCHCGIALQRKQKEFCSPTCYSEKSRVVERPSKEELSKIMGNTSLNKIGKLYGVSHAAVKKWAKSYGII